LAVIRWAADVTIQDLGSIGELDRARRAYAEIIRALVNLQSARLFQAFASVPRERFVGPGPWQIIDPKQIGRGYQRTPDHDPRHLYANVLVALDPERNLNNGEPAALARWLDLLSLRPGDSLLHIGCGAGYYTAIAAEVVDPGRVVAVEIDPTLASRAADHLASCARVSVVAAAPCGESFDAIFVNAGATEPLPGWLEQLEPGGRLLVPLTADLPRAGLGAGYMLLVTRCSSGLAAQFLGPVGIFHCAGARTLAGSEDLRRAFARGEQAQVRSLRREPHAEEPECWLHAAPSFCLSRRVP
jgi:protein-L-isoaspartate(D-aspartate) O-methyltransferase